jgi:transposase
VQDRDGAKSLLEVIRHQFSRLLRIWADQAYTGPLVDWVRGLRIHRPVYLEIVPRSSVANGFTVLPKRWIVERTLGWLNRCRRVEQRL